VALSFINTAPPPSIVYFPPNTDRLKNELFLISIYAELVDALISLQKEIVLIVSA